MPRPVALNPLFQSLSGQKGVGPQLAALLKRLLPSPEGQDPVVLDLLMHLPSGAIDRRRLTQVANTFVGHIATLKLTVDRHVPAPRSRPNLPHRVVAHDATGSIHLTYFGNRGGWVEKLLPVGAERFVSGTISFFQGEKQITHPDHVVPADQAADLPLVEPVYPLTQGLASRALSKLARQALSHIPPLEDWIDRRFLTDRGWPSFADALRAVHAPGRPEDVVPEGPARMRLAYDEYLAGQLALLIVRSQLVRARGIPRRFSGAITSRLEAALPYRLTAGQHAALAEIRADLASPNRMLRLLQGDVGAGKTVVALMAMAAVAEGEAQSAFMAPTELLAAQHYAALAPLCQAAGLPIALITGKQAAAERNAALAGLADGTIAIAVGTHALFQSAVAFRNLGLAVVDEQHRFGVHQRLALSAKSAGSDMLIMTATPIPRTLVLSNFGDMAVSTLREKPAGRQPIETAVLPSTEYDRVVARLKARLAEGAQAFWVSPLVEESEVLDVVSAQDRYLALKPVFGDRVGLVHGRLSAAAKQAVMDRFVAGSIQLLVATTVIEVGVDVPNATIMIVEHAERFGLAQLHQLRGRVGRGRARSACLMLFKEPLSETAKARLETIRTTDDGFVIAERDLELRGEGDVLGTRQSGLPGYHLAIPSVHRHLLDLAHAEAAAALDADPGLTGPRGDALRQLLYVFRKDLALPLLRAG